MTRVSGVDDNFIIKPRLVQDKTIRRTKTGKHCCGDQTKWYGGYHGRSKKWSGARRTCRTGDDGLDCKTSTFYGLPKIHKSKTIENACRENENVEYIEVKDSQDLTFRPIVAGPNCETSHLNLLLDILLKPFLENVKGYLRDEIDFLNFPPKDVPEDALLLSFDVVSLYSNVPHDLGRTAVEFWLERHPELINNRFSKELILEGLNIILENNVFSFDGSFYNQRKGTAMGTKVAPTYATLVLGYLEELMYEKITLEKGHDFAQYIIENWKRFLDDCFSIWPFSLEGLNYNDQIYTITFSGCTGVEIWKFNLY